MISINENIVLNKYLLEIIYNNKNVNISKNFFNYYNIIIKNGKYIFK